MSQTKFFTGTEKSLIRPKTLSHVLVMAIAILVHPVVSHAQSTESIQYTENKPDHTQRSVMKIDPVTLGLSIDVPIASYPGRGGTSIPINLSYSSKLWRIDFYSSYLTPTELLRTDSFPKFSEWATAGWTTGSDLPRIEWTGYDQPFSSNGLPYGGETSSPLYIKRIRVHMPGGASHELRASDDPVTEKTYADTYYAVDSSNLRYEVTSQLDGTLYLPDGSRYLLIASVGGYQYIDRHGNTLIYNPTNRQWHDTQGRVLDVPLPAAPAVGNYTYYLPSTTTTSFSYSVRWSKLEDALTTPSELYYLSRMMINPHGPGDSYDTHTPALFDSNETDRVYSGAERFNPIVLAEIVLPNGRSYQFTYNVFAEMTKIVYPTGAYEMFDYAAVPGVGYLRAPYAQANRGVTHRRLSPSGNGGDEQHWSYDPVANSNVLTVSIKAPDNTVTQHLMTAETSEESEYFGFSNPMLGTSFEGRFRAPGTGNQLGPMMRRTLSKWTTMVGPTGWPRNPKMVKQVNIQLDTGTSDALTTTTTMSYDDDLNVFATNRYGFTTISQNDGRTLDIESIPRPSLPLRTEEATFLVNDPDLTSTIRTNYRARNLLNLPTSTRIKDGSGTTIAKTQVFYDDYQTSTKPTDLLTYSEAVNGWTNPHTNVRGLPTTTGVWFNTTGTYIQTHAQYDQFGNVRKIWDANDKLSQVTYSGAYSFAYPTTALTPVPDADGVYGSSTALSTTAEYNANTGLMTKLIDSNGHQTNYAYDAINRLATITRPSGGGSTSYEYGNTPGNLYVRTQTSLDISRVVETYQYFDNLGRAFRSVINEGGSYSRTDTQFDSMGRVWRISNPYRTVSLNTVVNSNDLLWTTTIYDDLGRVRWTTSPGGAVITNTYSASTSSPLAAVVTVEDQAGKLRRSLSDALGRLVRVDEPDASSDIGDLGPVDEPEQATSYSYNLLGNLLQVTQGTQTRTFVYDSLSRLQSATNPESGTICYGTLNQSGQCQANGYDSNGNLLYRTDARGILTTYAYDALNRNKSIVYTHDLTGTAAVYRFYDGAINGKGRFWKSETVGELASRTTIDEYDSSGRPMVKSQQFYRAQAEAWSAPFITQRSYDLSGHVILQFYPSGHWVNYSYDVAGRLSGVAGNLGDGEYQIYGGSYKYDPAGRLEQELYGTLTPLYHKLHYNARGQIYDVRLSTQSWQAAEFDGDRGATVNYYSNQNFTSGFTGTNNNGNLIRSENYLPGSDFLQQNYAYDSLNRLKSVTEKQDGQTTLFAQGFEYDRFGNRTINTNPNVTWGDGINNLSMVIDPANNRLTEVGGLPTTYDEAGNLIQDGQAFSETSPPTYDAENRLIRVDRLQWRRGQLVPSGMPSTQYVYDADGRRVRRMGNGKFWQVYGFDGELLAEYREGGPLWPHIVVGHDATNFIPQTEYAYRNGQLLVKAAGGDDLRLDRFITNSYFAALGREPEIEELNTQRTALLQAGTSGEGDLLAQAITLGSELFDLENPGSEYNQRQRSDEQFVSDLYFAYLQRTPETSGLLYWVSVLQNPFYPSSRMNVRGAFELSSEFGAVISTIYGTYNAEITGRAARYVSNMYDAVPENNGNEENDITALEAAAAEGQEQTVLAARTVGINLFQPWLTGGQTDDQFVIALFNAFLQREPSAAEVSTWIATVQSQGRSQALESFSNLPATQALARTLYRELLWLTPDLLGTPRIISGRSGSLAGIKRHDYLPFGEELTNGYRSTLPAYGGDYVRQKFTQYERDNETGLDYAQARYYASTQGRFTGVDPLMGSGKPAEPQSWNRYSYCINNPLIFVDPSGLIWGEKDNQAAWFDSMEEMQKYGFNPMTNFLRGHPNAQGYLSFSRWQNHYEFVSSLAVAGGLVSGATGLRKAGFTSRELPFFLALEGTANAVDYVYRTETAQGLLNSQEANFLGMYSGVAGLEFAAAQQTRNGLSMFGKALGLRAQAQHLPGTPQAAKQLASEGTAWVFNDLATMSRVESEIFSRGVYTGFSRSHHRYGLQFDQPIGTQIFKDGRTIPLDYGQLKLRSNGMYHVVPRTGPGKQ